MFEGLTGEAGIQIWPLFLSYLHSTIPQDEAGKRKQMEEMILNWDSESRPGTSGDQK